jgi:hypothetical protein
MWRGQIVDAQWSDGQYFPAKIISIDKDNVKLVFCDYFPAQEITLTIDKIKVSPMLEERISLLRVGDEVCVRDCSDGLFYKGRIQDIQYLGIILFFDFFYKLLFFCR